MFRMNGNYVSFAPVGFKFRSIIPFLSFFHILQTVIQTVVATVPEADDEIRSQRAGNTNYILKSLTSAVKVKVYTCQCGQKGVNSQ